MVCSLFWFIYYKLVFARVLFGLQIPFVCESWSTSLDNFNVFIRVFHVHELLWELNPNRAKSPSLEVARKTTKFFKKHTRGRPLVWSQRGPLLLFFRFYFLISPPLGLDVVYHLGYFYVMCCECGDINGYRCQHRNAQQLRVY